MATTTNNDKRFYQLTLAIQKAINSIETPVKEKHVRSTIIGTFQEQSAITYWMVAIRLPLQDNRIVAWKFCHVTHKLLREGHPACLDDSQRHINMIENLGKLWVHLREGYGRLVHLYCNLLVCKLKFHARNPRFPGNLQLTADELDAIAENDVNNYFQICVELFDYMDDILTLQAAVFDSLGNARANSMTASGQCRLAALIPCAQDSSQIYDCNVRLLFRLHASLPADTLSGHRERFRQQFKKLSSFYKHASSLQYYRNLLTLPVLPSNPPNFLLQSDFGTYVTPVVSIPEPPPDEPDALGALVDTSDPSSQATTPDAFDIRTTPSPQPDPIVERDRLIEHLQNELRRMRTEMVEERNTIVGTAREQYTRLGMELREAKTALEDERHRAKILLEQTPEIKQKLAETEDKARVTDEKFQKLKGAYTQLREEHIALIRQKAEIDKLSASLRAEAAQHESAKAALQQQLNDRVKDVELLQQSSSTSEEVEAYKSELSNLRSELEQSRQKQVELEMLRVSMEALEIEHKTAKAEQEQKLATLAIDLKETTETLEIIKQEKEERENELNKIKEELSGLKEKSTDQYQRVVEEKEAAVKQVAELIQQHQQEKEEQAVSINKIQVELEKFQQKCIDVEMDFSNQCQQLKEEIENKNKEIDNIVNMKDNEVEQALGKVTILQNDIENIKQSFNEKIHEQSTEIISLVKKLSIYKNDNDSILKALVEEKDNIEAKFNEASEKIIMLENEITEKTNALSKLEISLAESQTTSKACMEELENNNRQEIEKLKEKLSFTREKKIELESKVSTMTKEIEDLRLKLNDTVSTIENQKIEFDDRYKEKVFEVAILNDKLQNAVDCKDEIIGNLKNMIAEKDIQVISLNIEVSKLSETVLRLEDELKETQAELEIGRNEFITLSEEHANIVHRNESNLVLKNRVFRELNVEISKLNREKEELINEKSNMVQEFSLKKQVFENFKIEMEETIEKLRNDYESIVNEKERITNTLNSEINNIKCECEQLKTEKESEIKTLNDNTAEQETLLRLQINEKDENISKTQSEVKLLREELAEIKNIKLKENEEMGLLLLEKEKERQMLVVKLERTENQRLNAECELQDLLQHNTILEVDVASLKKQLEETKKELEAQSTRIVSSAGEAALEVTTKALSALEAGSAQESSRAAADLATKAFEDLAKLDQVNGNEETLARSAILAAHNTAQLSAYATEVSNLSTDMSLSEKLNFECRTMLTATRQCLESLKHGTLENVSYEEVRVHVLNVSQFAAAADRLTGGALSVDDELAGMDRAIEEAASQIEEMLAASRAGDSGVKLEVNGKILDACTTLMAAVKLLVQDARALQNELGDPKTRQKMYRNNPQWSEGLISAAKAVVFAAKLLVSSADEAVGAAGRLEGMSAAAHEVAGSTAQLVAASRARAPPASEPLAKLTRASRSVAAATGAVVAAVRAGSALRHDTEALDTSALTLTATRRLEMESKVRALELESALDAERARLAALRKRHYHLAQAEENGSITNGK